MTEETGLFPHTDPALSDDDVVPVRGLSHLGSPRGGSGTTNSKKILPFVPLKRP